MAKKWPIYLSHSLSKLYLIIMLKVGGRTIIIARETFLDYWFCYVSLYMIVGFVNIHSSLQPFVSINCDEGKKKHHLKKMKGCSNCS